MTKKHFIIIAESIKLAKSKTASHEAQVAIDQIAKDLCAVFKNQNERFDKERFLAACSVEKIA